MSRPFNQLPVPASSERVRASSRRDNRKLARHGVSGNASRNSLCPEGTPETSAPFRRAIRHGNICSATTSHFVAG